VQRFVGFAQYFRQYIRSFSEIALPLTSLSKKDVAFTWDAACQTAFDKLKECLCSAPVLSIFDATLPIELHTDASNTALYQIVDGKLKPVAYHSRKFNSAERNYTVTERELLAIVDSCRHWRHYLYNASFTVRTDHRPL
jgi:RNase H-like domain found in reverse transcriptase